MPPEDDAPTPKPRTTGQADQAPPELEAPAPTEPTEPADPAYPAGPAAAPGLHVAPGSAEADLILTSLRTVETYALDALGNCAGAPSGQHFPRQAPRYEQADKLRAELDTIARIRAALGSRFVNGRRADIEEFFAREAAVWESRHATTHTVRPAAAS